MFMNQRSFFVEPAIGDAYEGGFYAGLFSMNGDGVATHRLVVASKSVGEFSGNWSGNNNTTGATSLIDGAANTALMAGQSTIGANCANLVTGGYDDWYMPSRKEMELLYFYFKPDTNQNNTQMPRGGNSFAVPQRSNYTTSPSIPPRTPLAAWQADATGGGGAQFFNRGTDGSAPPLYWDSTELAANKANRREFRTGYYANLGAYKSYQGLTRAVRKVAI
jgi:hypothetical protein